MAPIDSLEVSNRDFIAISVVGPITIHAAQLIPDGPVSISNRSWIPVIAEPIELEPTEEDFCVRLAPRVRESVSLLKIVHPLQLRVRPEFAYLDKILRQTHFSQRDLTCMFNCR